MLLILVFLGRGGGWKLKFSSRGNFKLVKSCQCEKLSPGLANLQLTTQETHLQVAVHVPVNINNIILYSTCINCLQNCLQIKLTDNLQ